MIQRGKDQVSMLNPPSGIVIIEGREWAIGNNGSGDIVLRSGTECHPEFINGMSLQAFCWWFNDGLQ